MNKDFKKRLSPAMLYFEIFYVIYIIMMIFQKHYQEAVVVTVMAILIFGYLIGFRPYKYSINRKILTIYKRIGKNKEVNLMSCETISDPIPKMTKLVMDPHGFELYTEDKKRVVVSPKERMDFLQTVLLANKRINVQVKDYAKNHKEMKRQQKKLRKKELKKGNIDIESEEE